MKRILILALSALTMLSGQTKAQEKTSWDLTSGLSSMTFTSSLTADDVKSGTEKAIKQGERSVSVIGTCYSISGDYVAGTGNKTVGNMLNAGVKLRTNQNGNKIVFTVTPSYVIHTFTMEAVSNYLNKDGVTSDIGVSVTKVEVDGVETVFTGGEFPVYTGTESGNLTLSGINAKESIAIYCDNSNSQGEQIGAYYELEWEQTTVTAPISATVTPETATIMEGNTCQLVGTLSGGDFEGEWVSDNEAVATVSGDGVVTGIAPGTANITYQWTEDQSQEAYKATAAVTVLEKLNKKKLLLLKSYDFTAMGDVTLTLESESAYKIYNAGNKVNNKVYFCTNEGLENLAVQGVYDNGRGWIIYDGSGLFEGASAGRCAAIGGIKEGWIVEFIHTSGDLFYTKCDGSDDGIRKEPVVIEANRHAYKALEDGMIGFELNVNKYLKSIAIYKPLTEGVDNASLTISSDGQGTFCSNIDLDFSDIEDVKAYIASGFIKNTGTVIMTRVTDVPAYTGLFIKGTPGTYDIPYKPSTAYYENLLKGNVETVSVNPEEGILENYYLSDGSDGLGFYRISSTRTMSANRAILQIPTWLNATQNESRAINIVFDDEMTGISDATVAETQQADCYDLMGRRVAQPKRGLYIKNGKKMIIK